MTRSYTFDVAGRSGQYLATGLPPGNFRDLRTPVSPQEDPLRRVLSLILIGLGVFAVAVAVMLPTYVYSSLAKVPLDQVSTTVLEGVASKALVVTDTGSGPVATIRENVDLTATAKVQSNFSRAEMKEGSDVAVWLLAVRVTDNKDNAVVTASKRQVCFDRFTSEGYVPPAGDTEPKCQPSSTFITKPDDKPPANPGDEPKEVVVENTQPGLNFKFPFGTEKHDYDVYDDSLGKAFTTKFSGTEEIEGVEMYKFVENVPDTQIATQDVPGSLVGSTESSLQAARFYRAIVTTWVEPVTGVMVKQQQEQHQELRVAGNSTGTVVFDGILTFNEKSVAQNLAQANENKGKLEFMSSTAPIAFGIAGGVLILLGGFLLLRKGKPEQAPPAHRPVKTHATT
jgi:DUF3068 family protein